MPHRAEQSVLGQLLPFRVHERLQVEFGPHLHPVVDLLRDLLATRVESALQPLELFFQRRHLLSEASEIIQLCLKGLSLCQLGMDVALYDGDRCIEVFGNLMVPSTHGVLRTTKEPPWIAHLGSVSSTSVASMPSVVPTMP